MDTDILPALQELRNGPGAFLTDSLAKMTSLGELYTAIVIMSVIYLCVNKDLGAYLLMGWIGGPAAPPSPVLYRSSSSRLSSPDVSVILRNRKRSYVLSNEITH